MTFQWYCKPLYEQITTHKNKTQQTIQYNITNKTNKTKKNRKKNRNKTKQKKTKPNKTKQNKTKQNKTKTK